MDFLKDEYKDKIKGDNLLAKRLQDESKLDWDDLAVKIQMELEKNISKMAKGGSIRTLYKQFNQEKPNILLIMIADDVASDFMREKFDKTVDWSKLSDSEKEKYNEDYRGNKTSFENYLMSEFVKLYYSDDSIKEKCKGSSHKTIDSIKSVMKDLAKKYPQDKYADGGMSQDEESILVYYVNHYPEDELALEIKAKATFNGLYEVLSNKGDAYEYIGVADSIVRERVFEKLAKIKGVKLPDGRTVPVRSEHAALNTYYDEIVGLIDGLVESYQGKYGLITFKAVNGIDTDSSKENIIAYFDKLIKFLETERQNEKLKDSWIQNEIDTIAKLLYSTRYKLINLG
jgi:hypothetical protein